MHQKTLAFSIIGFAIIAVLAVFSFVVAEVNYAIDTQQNSYQNFSFFSATSTSATSTNIASTGGYFFIAGAKAVDLYFSRGGATHANTGISRFRVQVTPDGTNWYDYSRLIGSDASATATSSVSISAATSTTVVSLDLRTDTFFGIRCIVQQVTDGEHTCLATARF